MPAGCGRPSPARSEEWGEGYCFERGWREVNNPCLPSQRWIASELDVLPMEVDALKRQQAETAAELDGLLPPILDRTFQGEL